MSMRIPTREDDEALLAMIMDRHLGASSSSLAKKIGSSSGKIRTMTNRVRDEDIAACVERVRGAYW